MTDPLQILTAVGTFAALAWHVRNWWADRLDLRLHAELGEHQWIKIEHVSPRPAVVLRLENHGRREIHVRAIRIRLLGGRTITLGEGMPRIPPAEGVPCSLKEGHPGHVFLAIELFDRATQELKVEIAGVDAIDGRGKAWPLPPREFEKVRTGALAILDEIRRKNDEWREREREIDRAEMASIAAENGAQASATGWPADEPTEPKSRIASATTLPDEASDAAGDEVDISEDEHASRRGTR